MEKFRELFEAKFILDKVYYEEDDKNIYVIYTGSKKQDTYSKKHYYIYGGASKSLQIYVMGGKLVAEYRSAGWNEPDNAKNIEDARRKK